MCLGGDSIQPEYVASVRDPESGDWEQSTGDPLSKDFDHAPTTDLDYLKNLAGYDRDAFTPPLDFFSHVTFQDALNHINPDYRITAAGRGGRNPTGNDIKAPDSQGEYALMDVSALKNVGGSDLSGKWGAVKDEVVRVTQQFNNALNSLMDDKEHWAGKTKIEAFENVRRSFVAPEKISASAGGMQILLDAFTRTIDYVYKNIEGNRPNYEYNVQLTHDEDHDEYVDKFNSFAKSVLGGTYSGNIQNIATNNPKFSTGKLPDLGTAPPPDPRKQQLGGGGIPNLGGGGGGLKTPDYTPPKLTDPKFPTTSDLPTDNLPTDNLPTDNLPTDEIGDPTQAASDMAPTGLGSPTQAASAAPNTGDAGRPPEGALGLGPKGVGDLRKKGGAAGSGGGGGGGVGRGPLGPKLASSRPASAPVAAARAGTVGAAGGAGLGGGAPGMGGPAAGHGAGQNDKAYQVMKALRRKKTGEQVMGKPDAVVPVVGEPEKADAARREAEDDQPDRIT
jgi:hypothetical protein